MTLEQKIRGTALVILLRIDKVKAVYSPILQDSGYLEKWLDFQKRYNDFMRPGMDKLLETPEKTYGFLQNFDEISEELEQRISAYSYQVSRKEDNIHNTGINPLAVAALVFIPIAALVFGRKK
jgi:hypothetical protein